MCQATTSLWLVCCRHWGRRQRVELAGSLGAAVSWMLLADWCPNLAACALGAVCKWTRRQWQRWRRGWLQREGVMWGVGRGQRAGVAVYEDHQMLCTGREGCVFVCVCILWALDAKFDWVVHADGQVFSTLLSMQVWRPWPHQRASKSSCTASACCPCQQLMGCYCYWHTVVCATCMYLTACCLLVGQHPIAWSAGMCAVHTWCVCWPARKYWLLGCTIMVGSQAELYTLEWGTLV